MKTMESVTKNIITLIVTLIGFLKFSLDRETFDFSYRLKRILRKLVVFQALYMVSKLDIGNNF